MQSRLTDAQFFLLIHLRPDKDEWHAFDALKPIERIVVTNRDHTRDTELFSEALGRRARDWPG